MHIGQFTSGSDSRKPPESLVIPSYIFSKPVNGSQPKSIFGFLQRDKAGRIPSLFE